MDDGAKKFSNGVQQPVDEVALTDSKIEPGHGRGNAKETYEGIFKLLVNNNLRYYFIQSCSVPISLFAILS